jgi:NAD(P)-dependent dehydrogenase (short-subunit alcohol dehydrogenase family)
VTTGVDGLVVLVTGASSGLGAELTRALHERGARVVAVARRSDRLDELRAGLDGLTVATCDVTSESDRNDVVQLALREHGRIDGLVNNAGFTSVVPAVKEDVDDFRQIVETNLVAPFALSKLVVAPMREVGGGSIVNVSSIIAFHSVAEVPEAGYAASKAGLVGLTRELASQWGRYGIRVNAVAPGFFPSEMTTVDEGTAPSWLTDAIPLGRLGRGSEIVGAVQYLLGGDSSYVTGQVVTVDGGMTTR